MATDDKLERQIFGILFEHGSEALLAIARAGGEVLAANTLFAEMVGCSPQSLLGTRASELFVPDHRAEDWTEQFMDRAGLHEEVGRPDLDEPLVVHLVKTSHHRNALIDRRAERGSADDLPAEAQVEQGA